MTRKKALQPQLEQAQTTDPSPEAVEKFDSLLAEEARKAPAPSRELEPYEIGAALRERMNLPAGASIEFKTGLLVLRIPPAEEKDQVVESEISAPDHTTAAAALDAAIRAAGPGETWSHEEARFFLHAVRYSDSRSKRISLKYIFRQRPSEASVERR